MPDKSLRWMIGTLRTPPIGARARIASGELLRRLQRGERLGFPHTRPMPGIGARVQEMRVADPETRIAWRIVVRIDPDAILVIHWFAKRTRRTSKNVIELCRKRLEDYDRG